MPHPTPLACTTAAPTTPPAPQPPSPLPAAKRRGNPNLALIPRCGARTRAGCACRAPAIHGKLRCRMHGGRSTGPRTAAGRACLAAARTIHGRYSADARAFNRHHVTFLGRSSVRLDATVYRDRLPPDLAARMTPFAPELLCPPRPTHGITRAEDRAMLQAETAALAPWKLAIALARQAGRPSRAGPAAPRGALTAAQARPHAPERGADTAATASPAVLPAAPPEPHAPIPPAAAQAAHHQAPGSTGAPAAAKPHAPNRAARRASSASAPARLAARSGAPAPERAASAAAAAPAVAPAAPASARAEPHAPIPPAPARNALDQTPESIRADQVAKPRATEFPGRGVIDSPAPARLVARPAPHAPKRTPTPHTASLTISPGRAARRWLRRQKLMHQNQPTGHRP